MKRPPGSDPFAGFRARLARLGCRLVLASASPRRIDLLREAGIDPEVVPAGIDEATPPFLTPGEITLWNARAKAAAVARRHPSAFVLAADTLVAHGGAILGKPGDGIEAFSMLRRLSGETHEVFSGVWISCGRTGRHRGFIERSRVTFRHLSDEEIRRAHALTDPLDKAGAYAAQEDPLGIIAGIEGSRTNVIGLPMERLARALRGLP